MENPRTEQQELKKVELIVSEEQQEGGEIKMKECEEKEEIVKGVEEVGDNAPVNEHKKDGVDLQEKENEEKEEQAGLKELQNTDEDVGSDSYEMFVDESDSEQVSNFDNNDDEPNSEALLTDAEIEELISEFLEVEGKAAEAQEALEKESLAQVESDVRAELAENLHGDALEVAVSTEMKTFVDEWEGVLDDLETQSALLLEQLDGAGVALPSLYKWIESQAPNGCCTEAWKKRAHWVGSQLTNELSQSVKDAEQYLHSCRPVRRRHGKLLEEGASGFLSKKLSANDQQNLVRNSEKDWSSFGEFFQSDKWSENNSFGSKNWASVYMASTPQQAANLGLKLPGVDEVEEIGEIDGDMDDPFLAAAVANEKETELLTEEQKRKYRKVREEDDAKVTRKLQSHLKQRRKRNRTYQGEALPEKETQSDMALSNECFQPIANVDNTGELSKPDVVVPDEAGKEDLNINGTCKRFREDENGAVDNKRSRTVIIDSDDEVQVVDDKSGSNISPVSNSGLDSRSQVDKVVDIIDVDIFSSTNSSTHNIRKKGPGNFHCTACSKVLKASEVIRHPLLGVVICSSCKFVVEEKMQLTQKDQVSNGYCRWCGNCSDLICCNSCKMLFCTMCIARNFGGEHLAEARASGWQCYCCSPILLHRFVAECEAALDTLVVSSSESDSLLSDAEIDVPVSNKKRQKKRIRRILDDAELGEETKKKIEIEKARQEHLKSMQAQSAGKTWSNTSSANGRATEGATVDATEGYIVNVAREDDEVPVRIASSISSRLKPHQVAGIRFMWENVIQSIKKVRSGDKGLGCVLAHTMGLGKTFQVIAFLYTAMRSVDLGLKTALVVTPVNVLHNWRQEFEKWKPVELKPLRVLMLEDVARERRAHLLSKWRVKGGVLLIGYAAFRNLSLGKHVKDRNAANEICYALQHGPDILVCDEAHMIKNTRADITQALKQVKTQRRIALTGSPLQNNLMEYYCMVDFVREGYLGSSQEFRNRFQNPIENGQHTNSTSDDVKIMNQRSHILYEQLKGFVQRMDMNVVKKDLPPKTVFVITVKLSPLQRKLYKKFLDMHGFTNGTFSSERITKRRCFFVGYQALAQIWNHPGLLQMAKEHKDYLRREDAVENFLDDDSCSDDNIECDVPNGEKQRTKNDLLPKKSESIFNHEEVDWWKDLLDEKIYKEVDYSGKMVLLLDILTMSSRIGDKALVFSQSLATLDMIELFLSRLPRKEREGKSWKQGKDWYRLDGSTPCSERQKLVERFNEPTNRRVKCTLISTRAGSLGINLHAANRVIVVDGSWNPTYDLQAIYRVWRYGQHKPVFAYRLMAHGTMEEKIYKRQVTKEGLAARVVDRQQIHRTMSKEEILHLFDFGDDENLDMPIQNQENPMSSSQEKTGEVRYSQEQKSILSHGTSSSDKLMESLLTRHYPRWIANFHEHETLLQENESERLSKEEQDMAWQNYQRSLLEWEEVNRTVYEDSVRQPVQDAAQRETNVPQQTKGSSRSRPVNQRKCTNLAHLLTLRSRGTKSGSSTICGECAQEISWENLNRDGRSR